MKTKTVQNRIISQPNANVCLDSYWKNVVEYYNATQRDINQTAKAYAEMFCGLTNDQIYKRLYEKLNYYYEILHQKAFQEDGCMIEIRSEARKAAFLLLARDTIVRSLKLS